MKKLFSVILAALMLFSAVSVVALADDVIVATVGVYTDPTAEVQSFTSLSAAADYVTATGQGLVITMQCDYEFSEPVTIGRQNTYFNVNGYALTYNNPGSTSPAITCTGTADWQFFYLLNKLPSETQSEKAVAQGNFINNSASKYFFKSYIIGFSRDAAYATESKFYGDITCDGNSNGGNRKPVTIDGDFVLNGNYLADWDQRRVTINGDMICHDFKTEPIGGLYIGGDLYTTSMSEARNAQFSVSATSNVYCTGKVELFLVNTGTAVNGKYFFDGQVEIRSGNKNAKFNSTVTIRDIGSTITQNALNFSGGVILDAPGYCLTDGTDIYPTDGTPFVKPTDVTLSVAPIPVANPLAVDVSMETGASMRLKAKSGIRFYTNVDKDKIAALKADGATVEMGTLIAPADLINGELKFADENDIYAENENYAVVPYADETYYTEDGFEGIVGSVVDVKTANANRGFIGRGYIKVSKDGESYVSYAEYAADDVANNTRTIAWIATQVKGSAEYDTLSAANKEVVDTYADLYIA